MTTKTITRLINGKKEKFIKSSFSDDYGKHCVGVCIKESCVYVINTNDNHGHALAFTYNEWFSFIKGVKNGEFDLSIGK